VTAWLRRNGLRLVFAASATWAVVGLFMEALFFSIPDDANRTSIECFVVAFVALVCAGATWVLARLRPQFLVPPSGLGARFWLPRSVLLPLLVGVLLAIAGGLAAYVKLRLTGDPADSQYGVSVAWVVVWYPAFLTPLVSVIVLWRAAVRHQ